MRPENGIDARINPLFSFYQAGNGDGCPVCASVMVENLTGPERAAAADRAESSGLAFSCVRASVEGAIHRISGSGEGFAEFAGPGAENREDVFGAVARAMRNRLAFEREPYTLAEGVSVSLSAPQVWGILNVTPDSFSDGGRFTTLENAFASAERMAADGAAVIDVGGESTRPGAAPVPEDEESRRVVPVIEAIASKLRVPVSVDTSKASVAKRAIEAGARVVNDVTALRDPEMAGAICSARAGAVLMHMLGEPRTMQRDPRYSNLFGEIARSLRAALAALEEAGGAPALIDPGIGFGKTVDHNLRLLSGAGAFGSIGRPVLVGPSRKSFLGAILDLPVEQRLEGTAAAAACAVMGGASVIRVHDVLQMKRVVKVAAAARRAGGVAW